MSLSRSNSLQLCQVRLAYLLKDGRLALTKPQTLHYGIEHNYWEPESNVVNAPEVVADFCKRQAKMQAGFGALLHA
jgi:hypothetical protein